MTTTQITARIDHRAAVAAGHNVPSGVTITIDVDVATLPEDVRPLLAARLSRQRDGTMLHCLRSGFIAVLAAPTVEAIVATVRADDAACRDAVAQAEARREAAIAKVMAASDDELIANWSDYHRAPSQFYLGDVHGSDYTAVLAAIEERLAAPRARVASAEAAERAAAEAARATAAAERAAAEQAVAAERAAWIAEHGSRRLQRLAAEGIEHDAVYRDERLAVDRPGWEWGPRDLGVSDPRNPPEAALDLLDEARSVAPDAKLAYYVISTDDEDSDDERGYVGRAEYLGRAIVTIRRIVV